MREGGRIPLFWRVTPIRLLAASFPVWYTVQALTASPSRTLRALVAAVAALTVASPRYGLHAVALLAPLGHAFESEVQANPIAGSEGMAVAFLGMWLLRASDDRPGPRLPAAMFVLALVVLSVSSSMSTIEFAAGGLLLAGAVLYLFRHRPALAVSLPAALCAGIIVATALNLVRSPTRFPIVGARASAGAVVACVALAVAARTRGRLRIASLSFAAVIEAALWYAAPHDGFSSAVDTGFALWMTVAIALGLVQSARMNASVRSGPAEAGPHENRHFNNV